MDASGAPIDIAVDNLAPRSVLVVPFSTDGIHPRLAGGLSIASVLQMRSAAGYQTLGPESLEAAFPEKPRVTPLDLFEIRRRIRPDLVAFVHVTTRLDLAVFAVRVYNGRSLALMRTETIQLRQTDVGAFPARLCRTINDGDCAWTVPVVAADIHSFGWDDFVLLDRVRGLRSVRDGAIQQPVLLDAVRSALPRLYAFIARERDIFAVTPTSDEGRHFVKAVEDFLNGDLINTKKRILAVRWSPAYQPFALYYLSRIAQQIDDRTEAVELLRQAVGKGLPKNLDILQQARMLTRRDGRPAALERLTELVRVAGYDPVQIAIALDLMISLVGEGTDQQLVESVLAGLDRETYPSMWNELLIRQLRQEFDVGRLLRISARRLNPTQFPFVEKNLDRLSIHLTRDPAVNLFLYEINAGQRRMEEAERYLNSAYTLKAADTAVNIAIGIHFAARKSDPGGAQIYFEQAYQNLSHDPGSFGNEWLGEYASGLLASGAWQKSIEIYRILVTDSRSPGVLTGYAEALFNAGQSAAAVETLDRIERIQPGLPEAYRLRYRIAQASGEASRVEALEPVLALVTGTRDRLAGNAGQLDALVHGPVLELPLLSDGEGGMRLVRTALLVADPLVPDPLESGALSFHRLREDASVIANFRRLASRVVKLHDGGGDLAGSIEEMLEKGGLAGRSEALRDLLRAAGVDLLMVASANAESEVREEREFIDVTARLALFRTDDMAIFTTERTVEYPRQTIYAFRTGGGVMVCLMLAGLLVGLGYLNYRLWLRRNPLRHANYLIRRGDYLSAAHVLDSDGYATEAEKLKGYHYFNGGDYRRAFEHFVKIKDYAKVLDTLPLIDRDDRTCNLVGDLALESHDHGKAIEMYSRTDNLAGLARAYDRMGQPKMAGEIRARYYLRMENIERAAQEYSRIGENTRAGQIHFDSFEYEKAIEYFKADNNHEMVEKCRVRLGRTHAARFQVDPSRLKRFDIAVDARMDDTQKMPTSQPAKAKPSGPGAAAAEGRTTSGNLDDLNEFVIEGGADLDKYYRDDEDR